MPVTECDAAARETVGAAARAVVASGRVAPVTTVLALRAVVVAAGVAAERETIGCSVAVRETVAVGRAVAARDTVVCFVVWVAAVFTTPRPSPRAEDIVVVVFDAPRGFGAGSARAAPPIAAIIKALKNVSFKFTYLHLSAILYHFFYV